MPGQKICGCCPGRVTAEEMEPVIREKRNKDLLMSQRFGACPGEEELPHRYEFLQQFRKDSRAIRRTAPGQ